MRLRISFLAMFFLFTSFIFPYQDIKNLSLSAEGIEKFEIDCGAGFLKVYGIEGQSKIEVKAEIVLKGKSERKKEEYFRKYVDLSLKKRGNRAVLISKIRHPRSIISFGYGKINLTVSMPKNMDLNIDDGSGSMIIENITANLEIEDGAGDIEVDNIQGKLYIDDGSGDIEVENIKGNVDIDDGSGDVDVIDIFGNVSIDDGSGTIYVRNIDGNVTVSDGSGSINIDGVEKDVLIRDDGSGSIKISNVKGKVIK